MSGKQCQAVVRGAKPHRATVRVTVTHPRWKQTAYLCDRHLPPFQRKAARTPDIEVLVYPLEGADRWVSR